MRILAEVGFEIACAVVASGSDYRVKPAKVLDDAEIVGRLRLDLSEQPQQVGQHVGVLAAEFDLGPVARDEYGDQVVHPHQRDVSGQHEPDGADRSPGTVREGRVVGHPVA